MSNQEIPLKDLSLKESQIQSIESSEYLFADTELPAPRYTSYEAQNIELFVKHLWNTYYKSKSEAVTVKQVG